MRRRLLIGSVCAAAAIAFAGGPSWADTLQLKDGTSLQGRVMDAGTNYWIKDADGHSQTVPKESVQQWVKGDAAGAATVGPTAGPAAASATAEGGRGAAATLPGGAMAGGASFKAVKAKADKCDTPIQAVALWQSYLDAHPPAADAPPAKEQLAYWQQLVNGNAERINGKWVWGADRLKLLKQVRDLLKQARKDIDSNQMLAGVHELEQAAKLYPNDFEANFELGYINLSQGVMANDNKKTDAGLKSMEQAVKLRPNCAAALSDLSIVYAFKRQWAVAVDTAYRAVKLEDNKGTVQNLVNTIVYAPVGMRNNSKVKPIAEQAMLLATKYGIGGQPGHDWEWVRPEATDHKRKAADDGDDEHDDSEQKGPPGIIGNGSGELLSADGYILTNRHVAKDGDYLMVRLADGTMKVADRVVIDDEQDMAVIKIKTDQKLPFIRLARYDHPPVGEDVDVFGFPLLGLVASLNSSVKMTRGIVTAWDDDHPMCDVTVDANINPGNSGGPMVDHFGNLLGIATAKSFAGNIEGNASISSYGLGQSSGHIRKFLAKQAAKLAGLVVVPGTEDKVLSNEELATKLTPVTVCVLICRGAPPVDGAAPKAPAQP